MPSSILVIISGYDPGWLRITEQIISNSLANNLKPVLLDASKLSTTPPDSFDRRVLKLGKIPFPGHDLRERIIKLGAEYLDVEEINIQKSLTDLSSNALNDLDIATKSALITYFRTDIPDLRKPRIKRTSESLRTEGSKLYWAVRKILETRDFEKLYIPNGRFPNQKMPMLAASELGVKTIHFEKGESKNSAYLQPYTPQDRIASQRAVDEVLDKITEIEIDHLAKDWLKRRSPDSKSINEFSEGWIDAVDPAFMDAIKGKKVVGFFTSSQDEFMFLGPEWHLHSWESQFEAFTTLLSFFESLGYFCYLRVHPNLATKEHQCFTRERRDILKLTAAHPSLKVIWHDEPANSYQLLKHTDQVVVWDSTIGLEASALGIPVIACATTRYGLIVDIQEVLGKEVLGNDFVLKHNVDSHKANRFIAYLNKRDVQLEVPIESWIPWDVNNPSFLVKISALTVSGGAPTVLDGFIATFDVWRHRRLTFNLSLLQNKLKKH